MIALKRLKNPDKRMQVQQELAIKSEHVASRKIFADEVVRFYGK